MSATTPADGLTGSYSPRSLSDIILSVFSGLALYDAIELTILVFTTFTAYKGFYFWSLLLSALLGVILESVGFMLKFFDLAPLALSVTMFIVGWYFMVTGQALVLYSRLHRVLHNPKVLSLIRHMILTHAILFHISTSVVLYGSNFSSNPAFARAYSIIERVQLIAFNLQEIIISGLYLHETIKLFKMHPQRRGCESNIMYQLLGINVAIILLDVGIVTLEFLDYYALQLIIKPFVYSVKLKLEIAVLGKLVFIVHLHCYQSQVVPGNEIISGFLGT